MGQLETIIVNEFDVRMSECCVAKPIKTIRKVLAKTLYFQTALKMENYYRKSKENKREQSVVFKVYGNDAYEGNVFVHPSAMSSIEWKNIDWIVYLDIMYTSKPFMRGVCAIKYEWIRKLLPKVNEKFAWMHANQEDEQKNDDFVVREVIEPMKVKQSKEEEKQSNIDNVRER